MQRPHHRPLIVAHRGGHWPDHPENSISAFRAALQGGADLVECDVRLGSDNKLFCSHDAEVGGQQVEEMTPNQRRALRMPDLQEVINLLEEYPERGLVIEAKTWRAGEAITDRVLPTPNRYLISFSDRVVSRAYSLGWQAGYLQTGGPELARDLAPQDGLLGPSVQMAMAYSDEELGRSNVWTVDDLHMASLLAERGVWALTTNYPLQLIEYFS